MSLLIDGYNSIYAAGIVPKGSGPGGLERSRAALLSFLAESVESAELARTTVVFDAGPDAPRGLPRSWSFRGITVRFATGYDDADALIEELIQTDSAPRQLTVVSSDHRVQRAARRRRAKAVDSDRWFSDALRERRTRSNQSLEDAQLAKPSNPPTEAEVARWIKRFEAIEGLPSDPQLDGPFPPGYAEDLGE